LPSGHPEVLTLGVLHQLLGGGAASKLFRELRDRLGLVYDVGSSVYTTGVTGVLEITFSAPARQAEACWEAVLRILEQVVAGEIADDEVMLARRALAAGIVLGSEGTDALMEALAGEFLARGRRFDAAAVRRELDLVTPERVRALATRVVRLDAIAGAVCGPGAGLRLPGALARRVA
jgi:predicted Zn-dependent peptidase